MLTTGLPFTLTYTMNKTCFNQAKLALWNSLVFFGRIKTSTGPNASYEMAAHTMTDPPPSLTPNTWQDAVGWTQP